MHRRVAAIRGRHRERPDYLAYLDQLDQPRISKEQMPCTRAKLPTLRHLQTSDSSGVTPHVSAQVPLNKSVTDNSAALRVWYAECPYLKHENKADEWRTKSASALRS